MCYQSSCCCGNLSIIYFALSFSPLHVLIHCESPPAPLSSALYPSFTSPSRVSVVGSSLLCTVNIDSWVVCGCGHMMLFRCAVSIISLLPEQLFSCEGYLQNSLPKLLHTSTLVLNLLCLFLVFEPLIIVHFSMVYGIITQLAFPLSFSSLSCL